MKLSKAGIVTVKCNRCKYEREYPVYMKGEKKLRPSYCSNCGKKFDNLEN